MDGIDAIMKLIGLPNEWTQTGDQGSIGVLNKVLYIESETANASHFIMGHHSDNSFCA